MGNSIADGPLGYLGSAVIFGSLLAVIALAYYRTAISHVALFWAAFILTRPLGALVGDFLDKAPCERRARAEPVGASLVLALAIAFLILTVRQRAAPSNISQKV